MCGIAGYVGVGDRGILEAMTNTLAHRGPDDSGFLIRENVGLGHRRLSIIDLSPTGHQPMGSADAKVQIVFNGEIYNFRELRLELERKGYVFRGASDTEAIIYLYQEYGRDCFKKLSGMFALAIYDFTREELLLARDPLGKKPLYWCRIDNTLLFGSELKALLPHPLFDKKINLSAVNKYFTYDYIPTPDTIYQGTHKLKPGHWLAYKSGGVAMGEFWDISFSADETASRLSREGDETAILQAVDQRLGEAVKKRLVADVPVGVLLSGGIDSSAVAYYAQQGSQRPIQTFSIGFTEKSFDESPYAREVAKFLGTNHHEHVFGPRDCLALIPEIANFIDEPLADYSILPTYLLSRFARQHVTVALGGDGGDELFFGYGTIIAERVANVLARFPRVSDHILTALKNIFPVSHAHFNHRFKLERFLSGLNAPPLYRHHAWMGTFQRADRARLFAPEIWRELEGQNEYEDIDRYSMRLQTLSRYDQLIYLYMRTYLMDQVLVKVDRASMAASLEVRAPFLDYEFVDFVNSLSYTYKIKGFTTKHLLRRVLAGKLPSHIISRSKRGFGVPLSAWLTKELRPLLVGELSADSLRPGGLFNAAFVESLVHEHLTGKRDRRKELWSLLVWQLYAKRWL